MPEHVHDAQVRAFRVAHHHRWADAAREAARSAERRGGGSGEEGGRGGLPVAATEGLPMCPPLDLASLAEELTRKALRLGSPDNITVTIVAFEYD